MIRRLIILLLIVGCGTEPEDEIKEVDWLLTQDTSNINEGSRNFNGTNLYYTNGYNPTIIDTDSSYALHYYVFFYTYIFQGDTIYRADSVRTITHFVEPNYFEIIETIGETRKLFSEDYEIFKFEYK